MKKACIACALFALIQSANAETTGSGGPTIKFASIAAESQTLIGGTGGVLFTHGSWTWGFGGGSYSSNGNVDTALNYGGFNIRSSYNLTDTLELGAGVLLGGGDIRLRDGVQDSFSIAEPEISMQYTATEYVKVVGSVSHRFVTGTTTVQENSLNGSTFGVSLMFGDFL